MKKNTYHVIGIMSGTSLDGLDLALCRFQRYHGRWQYGILHAATYIYPDIWKERLQAAAGLNARDFLLLHKEYGKYLGDAVKKFLGSTLEAELVASHGHTVYHQPESGLTFQLGDGASLAASCEIPTVSDFRTLDVAFGGQGAPLVPIGDELLFGGYDICLNLGGFANMSYKDGNMRKAFDICPVNIILNRMARQLGYEFDPDGRLGRLGKPNDSIFGELNGLSYYSQTGPRSLSLEWLEKYFIPVLNQADISIEDKLCSVYEHIVYQISHCIKPFGSSAILMTGGGTFNTFLVERLKKTAASFVIPGRELIKYKEALIFALLGLLRYRNEINCLASATGSRKDLSTGIIHAP